MCQTSREITNSDSLVKNDFIRHNCQSVSIICTEWKIYIKKLKCDYWNVKNFHTFYKSYNVVSSLDAMRTACVTFQCSSFSSKIITLLVRKISILNHNYNFYKFKIQIHNVVAEKNVSVKDSNEKTEMTNITKKD